MTYFFRSSPSLRRVLILPYVCLVFVLAAGIGYLSYQAGSRTVGDVTDRVLLGAVERIGQAVKLHIDGSKAVLEVAFPSEIPAPPDLSAHLETLRSRFWVATALYPDLINYIYYGNRAGQDVALLRLSPLEAQLRVKLSPAEHRRYYNFLGRSGELKPGIVESVIFEPRERPWYQIAQMEKGDTWTPVYIDFGGRYLVITRARQMLSADGQFEGVVAADVSLKALDSYLTQLKPSQNGLAFVMEADGFLIASSSVGDDLRTGADGGIHRQNAADDQNAMLKATYLEVKKRLDSAQTVASAGSTFSFAGPGGHTVHVAYDWIRDAAGLEWITVVAIPRDDFMGDVLKNAAFTGFAGILAVILSILFGLIIVDWVVKDIGHLSDITGKIGQGDLQARIAIDRRDEIGQLASSIELMQANLSTDKLTGLTSRAALLHYLESGIAHYTNAANTVPGFAVLFIDLNHFKPINDKYGHQLGDRTLVEIAGRLKQAIRPGDVAARYGGDEFVIVLWQMNDLESVGIIIDNLNRLLSKPLQCFEDLADGRSICVGASIGVGLYPGDGDDAETLIKHADQKMYQEKLKR